MPGQTGQGPFPVRKLHGNPRCLVAGFWASSFWTSRAHTLSQLGPTSTSNAWQSQGISVHSLLSVSCQHQDSGMLLSSLWELQRRLSEASWADQHWRENAPVQSTNHENHSLAVRCAQASPFRGASVCGPLSHKGQLQVSNLRKSLRIRKEA